MTDYTELAQRMRDAAHDPNARHSETDPLLIEGADTITSLAQRNVEAVRDEGMAVARPYEPSDFELRMQVMHAAASAGAGDDTTYLARGLYQFLTEKREPQLPTPPEGMHYILEPNDAAHLDLYGQRLTQAQYDAVVRHLRPAPAHGLAVGDEVSADRMLDLPRGSVIRDGDGDTYERTDDAAHRTMGEHWQRVWEDGDRGVHYSASEIQSYGTVRVVSLPEPAETPDPAPSPEPEDTTPRVGDTVRVISEPVGTDPGLGHARCAGETGILRVEGDGYLVRHEDGAPSEHSGPLSDFELIERAK